MTAEFTIDQATLPPGLPDRSRQDIIPGGAPVQFAAVYPPPNHTTYKWELLTQPSGVAVAFSDPNIHNPTVDFGMNYGGYLIRLTVDEGTATEDVSVRAVYLKWPVSNRALPALAETNQDNSQPPNTGVRGWEEKVIDYLWWVENTIGGGVVTPTGLGRIHVDAVNGNDVSGTGSREKPYQTLAVAVTSPRCAPPTSAAEFLTGIEFVCAPGHYGPVLPAPPTFLPLPQRQKIKFTGTDVIINHVLEWGLYEVNYTAYGLLPNDFPPMLWVDGDVGAMRPMRVKAAPIDTSGNAVFCVSGITTVKKDAGGLSLNSKQLYMRNVVAAYLGTTASAAAAVGDETGVLTAHLENCTFGDYNAANGCVIGGEREPLLPTKANQVRIYAHNCSFRQRIYANTEIREATRCSFHGMDRNRMVSSGGSLVPVSDGLIGFDKGVTFYDCEFNDDTIPYDVGWDGVTFPSAQAPCFDEVSYRSWLDMEVAGGPAILNNVGSPSLSTYPRKSTFQGVYLGSVGPVDLAPIVIGAPFPIVLDVQEYIDTPDFLHRPGTAPVQCLRGGHFRFTFSVTWESQQLFISNTIGAALQVTPMGGGAAIVPQTKKFSACDFFGLRATCTLPSYEMTLNDGDSVELVAWRDGPITGIGPLLLEIEDTWLRIDRLS